MNNKNTGSIVLIIILSLLVILLSATLIILLGGNMKMPFIGINFSNKISNHKVFEEKYNNNFDKIEIFLESGNLEIKESNEITSLEIYSEDEKYEIDTNNNKLYVNIKTKRKFFLFNYKLAKIVLYLPKDYDKEIKIDNNYGDVSIEGFEKANININEKCGDIDIIKANNVILNNNLGDINVGVINDGEITQNCGDIKIDTVNNIIAHNDLGDIKINNIMESLDLDNNCGDIKIENAVLIKNSKINDSLGDIKIKKLSGAYIEAKTSLGYTKITNNDRKSEIILNVENSCGDIKINY